MSAIVRSGLAAFAAFVVSATPAMADCQHGLGVSRIVEIDATAGPVFGMITKQTREERFLGPKEVVLTFDDGPMPGVTRPILDTLDRYCTKATFFSVGKMAIAYPEQIREILKRGHTLGTHTWSHPMSLPRLKGDKARDQIESGFAAVAMAAGQPIAPFFRFPGLNDSPSLIAHLESRNIATFTVDVVSNDSYISDPARLIEQTLQQLDAEKGGIMLFHDIKPQTARALPAILAEIKARGFRVVHLRAKAPFVPDAAYAQAVRAHVAVKNPGAIRQLVAITDTETPPAPARSIVPAPTDAVTARPAPVASAPEMAVAGLERASSRRQTPPAALTDVSSWAAVVAEPKAQQQAQAKPITAAASDAAAPATSPLPASAESAQTQAVAQASGDWPEVRRNGRVIRVQQPRQPVSASASTEVKPAAAPATPSPEKAAPKAEAKPASVVVAPLVVAPVTAPQTTPEAKPVVATTPSTPQRPRIINAPDASDAAAPATAATAVAPATPDEKPAAKAKTPETSPKAIATAPGTEKPAAAKIEAAATPPPAVQSAPAKPANLAAAVNAVVPTALVISPSPGGAGIEVLAGSYAAPAANASAAQPSDSAVTAGRFAVPEIIAGSYRQQPATPPAPASEPRRAEGSKQKRAP